jgi:hypothetical protein
MSKFRAEFESCAIACCDTNVAKVPALTKRVLETLRSGRY